MFALVSSKELALRSIEPDTTVADPVPVLFTELVKAVIFSRASLYKVLSSDGTLILNNPSILSRTLCKKVFCAFCLGRDLSICWNSGEVNT